jgi:hypothetical protein
LLVILDNETGRHLVPHLFTGLNVSASSVELIQNNLEGIRKWDSLVLKKAEKIRSSRQSVTADLVFDTSTPFSSFMLM